MPRSLHLNPPFRAEHIGSFLRPATLVQKRFDYEAQKCSAEELRALEDESIPAVVALQREVGVKTITDGEMRRGAFYEGMFEKLEGMTPVPNRPLSEFKQYVPYVAIFNMMGLTGYSSIYCSSKIQRKRGIHTEDFAFLKGLVSPEEVKRIKVTVCGPTWMHLRHGTEYTYDKSVYKTDEEYFADLIRVYREELAALYELGCRHIQFDDPTFAFFCADSMIVGMEQAGVDHEALLSQYIDVYNEILKDQPADLTLGLHTCRGNFKGMHYSGGSLDRIAVKLFNDLNIDCYYLEYDTERAGGLEPLRHLPLNKTVVLGLVTTKTGKMESVDDIRARVESAVEIISQGSPKRSREDALNQICISPQCGFASVFEGNPISEEDERSKLGLVVEVARQVWG
ncbi:predicted protein [Postia placenta Mad-698-R]|uniref:Cobalamin-independent methionine synthase MetE C-terminal/archaeal domain-containing protein n=1 Tax=Postia placenta MAD-698-R-SB12 TaxID=670580 RepID=A0A1X6NFT7_9APHY|nr:hypothetical protein POSPLADRAFT_1130022 [Postia placenta MAD-698-R-SB12]EED82770.1 predicted protein [Postia placenta Mad-698-R]OSX67499.1 hypothetical protein POSPLADRAFT_1130022 [Postia placenta MAD-698-R-SB12]